MKKGIRVLLLTLLCAALLCGTAYADDAGGMFAISMSDGVTAIPQLADCTNAPVLSAEIPQGIAVQDYYHGAQRLSLTYSGTQEGAYYMVMVLKGSNTTPSTDNVVYMDQVTAAGTAVEFNIYPISMEIGQIYHVCISTNAGDGSGLAEVGSFQYGKDQKLYTVNFYDEDGITLLGTTNAYRGDTPAFQGETPTKAPTDEWCYTFSTWTPEITAVTSDADYTAVFAQDAHNYGEPEWTWTADCSSAAAVFTCSVGGETKSVEATVGEPVENTDGSKTYTATVTLLGQTYTDSKTLGTLAGGTYVLNSDYIYLESGASRQLTVVNSDTGETVDSALGLVWAAENADIATVDGNGNVTATQVGTTAITVKTDDGSIDLSCTVQVLFSDVNDPDAYYFNPVYWAKENGITSGTSPTTFSPSKTCTRGQIVTFLWIYNGRPEPSSLDNPFMDVKESDYFYKAVLWAKEKGITSVTSATTFSPGNPCTRGHIVTFLWISLDRPEPNDLNNPFEDVSEDNYFYKAVLWAKEAGVTSGTSATTFSPGKACTRAQAMTFLYKTVY